jgi:uncharacterized membrane protein
MITGLISFFGGSVFRMLWGEISHWLTAAQDHKQELDRMRLQGDLEAIKLQADLKVEVIRVQGESNISELEAQGWLEAVKGTTQKIGIAWVDAWNAVIRPSVATWAILMITVAEFGLIVLSDFAGAVASAALGIYLADRNLAKRGK